METFDLSRYDRRSNDLTTYDVYIETAKARRVAAFSCKAHAIDFAKLTADCTADNATRRVVVVCRDSSAIVASFS